MLDNPELLKGKNQKEVVETPNDNKAVDNSYKDPESYQDPAFEDLWNELEEEDNKDLEENTNENIENEPILPSSTTGTDFNSEDWEEVD